jgi:hypothetical protein
VEKCEEAKHSARRRAAEDALVTAQLDVRAVRLTGGPWPLHQAAFSPSLGEMRPGASVVARQRGWVAVGCRRQRAQRPSKHYTALGTRPEPPAHGNTAEARCCTGYASRRVFRLSPLSEAGSSGVGRKFK